MNRRWMTASLAGVFLMVGCSADETGEVAVSEPGASSTATSTSIDVADGESASDEDQGPTTTATVPLGDDAHASSAGCGAALPTDLDQFRLASRSIDSSGGERSYLVYVPESYQGDEPAMLVFNFHGAGSNKEQQVAYAALGPYADEDGAIVVAPDAVAEVERWSPYGFGGPADDLVFFDDLLAAVAEEFCVDEEGVFLTGMSSGGFMSASVACARSEVVAAAAPVTATVWAEGSCGDAPPIPYAYFHGTDDSVVPFLGPRAGADGEPGTGSVEASSAAWAAQNGCDSEPVDERIEPDVIHRAWTNCDAPTDLYIVEGGGHTWPGAIPLAPLGHTTATISATDIIWTLFRETWSAAS